MFPVVFSGAWSFLCGLVGLGVLVAALAAFCVVRDIASETLT